MKIWSKTLTYGDLVRAAPDGVALDDATLIDGPRSRRFTGVRLEGLTARHRRRPNSGTRGANPGPVRAATWDEHGLWMAALFARDPNARILGAADYAGAAVFHALTSCRYAGFPLGGAIDRGPNVPYVDR